MHFIYKISNNLNHKIYIGQTIDPSRRWAEHKSCRTHGMVITRAIIKYGADNFNFDVIASCRTLEDANIIEPMIILQYNSNDKIYGYNVDPGGNVAPRNEETCKKISISSMGKPGTNKGRSFSNEWKNALSKSNAGKEQLAGRRFTPEVEKEICRLYVEEEKTAYYIAKQFDCHRSLIREILIRNKIKKRKINYTKLEKELKICLIYKNGNISKAELSRQFKCGKTTIRRILIKHNIIPGPKSEDIDISSRRFTKQIEKEICKLYVEENQSFCLIANKFNCNNSLVRDILIRNKIEIRKPFKNKFTLEKELEICLIYKEGNISMTELAKKFNCNRKNSIRDILIRHGIDLKKK